jgi:hypothetical protein
VSPIRLMVDSDIMKKFVGLTQSHKTGSIIESCQFLITCSRFCSHAMYDYFLTPSFTCRLIFFLVLVTG